LNAVPLCRLGRSNTLVIFSDIHVGANHFRADRFEEALKWCRDQDATIYLNGDLLENSVLDGQHAGLKLMDQATLPTEQIKYLMDAFKPFAKRNRIAGVTQGNHEARSGRTALLDLCEILAHHLGVEYHRIGGYVRFVAGKELYLGGIQHGRSGASNIWLELDRYMARLYPQADFVAAGHNHALGAREVGALGISSQGCEMLDQRWQIRTGTYLGYADYVRNMGLPPGPVGSPILRFAPDRHVMDVDCRTLRWDDL